MNIEVRNLGIIKKATIDLSKNFILFTGYNNTGKTYLNYLLYGFFKLSYEKIEKELSTLFEVEDLSNEKALEIKLKFDFISKKDEILSIYNKLLLNYCTELYAGKEIKPQIKLNFSEKDIKELLSIGQPALTGTEVYKIKEGILSATYYSTQPDQIKQKGNVVSWLKNKRIENLIEFDFGRINLFIDNTYFFPAERAALNQYTRDIFYTKFEESQRSFSEKNKSTLKYPLAIADYMKLVYKLYEVRENKTKYSNFSDKIEKILGGKISVDEDSSIKFQMKDSEEMDIHLTSSTVKSLAVLVLYLKHLAKEGDVIFIDEPEMNLHPANQRKLTRILAELSNSGIKVIISTHSYYVSKELASIVMLDKDFSEKEELITEFNFSKEELIHRKDIAAYSFNSNGEVKENKINGYGIEVESFDDEIGEQSQMFDKIYFMTGDDE